ncbi:MAG: sigma-70 family RNA polymerase sigma factor [Kiritimatiellae bacterium]|nr:sigma-70 family RNA polymerase sigma factor [Kiritimatiellia bacterium]
MKPTIKELSRQFLADRYVLTGFIHGLVRDPGAAEDIFQEVWIRLAEAVERGMTIENPRKWCRGVARNLILHYWRDKQTAKVAFDSRLVEAAEQAFDEQDHARDFWEMRRQALVGCVEGLPNKSKRLLSLKYEAGLTSEAVGERLKKSAASIMMALSRVRRALAQCVERQLRTTQYGVS